MSDTQALYNSKITRVYLEYLKKHYPDLDATPVLEYAGMQEYEVEDPNHWFNQRQADRFNQRLVEATKDPDISRKAGRYATSTEGLGAAKHYLLGLLSLSTLYLLIGKVYLLFSRGVAIRAKKLGPQKIEIISRPREGVSEKPYQCAYRVGMFESVAKFFTQQYAHVEHPECFHEGNDCCHYIITWDRNQTQIFKQIRNLIFTVGIPVSGGLFFVVPFETWRIWVLMIGLVAMTAAFVVERFSFKEMAAILEMKGEEAEEIIEEMEIRHDNALLIQEIGKTVSSVFVVDKLIEAVLQAIKMHADFDRGVIFLADSQKKSLCYIAGYGYGQVKETVLQSVEFNLANPDSKGEFVLAFRNRKPFLVNDVSNIKSKLSPKSVQFIKDMGVQSLICVPIVYKGESIGILSVDNVRSKRPLVTSDINLLMGVASQTAVGIVNALSFQKIQESEKKYRDLVETANSIIMRIDTVGSITFFNEYAQRFFGYSASQIIGKNVTDIFHHSEGSSQNHFNNLIAEIKEFPDKTIFNESQSKLQNGKKAWTAWTYKPVFDKGGALVEILCIGNDITERKRAELENRELEIRLQRAHKMEAIGTLAGGVAHDLNNILSGIVSYPDLLLMGLPPESPLRKPLMTIQKSGKRAAAIVQDLLTLARRGVTTKEVVNLNTVIREYLKSPEFHMVQETFPGVQVKTELPEGVLNIVGSSLHLSKTVMNLVNNALEAIDNFGSVTIATENRYVDTLINGYDQVVDGDYVTLKVLDTGCGIEVQDLERIFEPFYTKKVMGKSGTGLGMAVVWGTVKDHNGYIDVSSTIGRGTLFTLYFPAVRKKLDTQKPKMASIEEIKGQGESILVVDDVLEQRELAFEMLTGLGYNVKTVSSGEEAVEYLQEKTVDLVLLDMIMQPGMDGLDTYRKILQLKPDQRAIITSGFAETERVKAALNLGACAYIKKPYIMETIGKALIAELKK